MSVFWIGVALWIIPFLIAGGWMQKANWRYIHLYREMHDVELLLPGEGDTPRTQLQSFAPSSSWRLWRILWEPQADPALERARRTVVRRFWIMNVFLWGGAFIPIGLSLH